MKILFLHGWRLTPGGIKPTYLKSHGHEVLNPALPDDDFDAAVRIAQAEFDGHKPDVVVGSSRGGAVAMNIDSSKTPLVLLCPAWKRWGAATKVKPNAVILHSKADDVVPFADSEELLRNSGLPMAPLLQAGNDHRLADEAPLIALRWALRLFESKQPLPWLVKEVPPLPPISWQEDATAFLENVQVEIIPWIEQSTIPFFHLRKDPSTNEHGIIDKDRTGVFLRIGDHHFILTASHGIQDAIENETYLFMSWDDEEHFMIPIVDDVIVTTDPTTLDVAVIRLSPANTRKLLLRHKPISLANTVRNCRNSSGLMLLFGYPRAGTEFVTQNALAELQPPRMESLKFICKESAGGWKKTELKYSPLMHLVVGMIRNGYSGKMGRNRLLPEHSGIQGISGCGIWRIADHARGKSLDQIGMADCKLIAIEHSYDEEAGKVAGTWIDLTLEVLANSFPEVKPAMGILYPR